MKDENNDLFENSGGKWQGLRNNPASRSSHYSFEQIAELGIMVIALIIILFYFGKAIYGNIQKKETEKRCTHSVIAEYIDYEIVLNKKAKWKEYEPASYYEYKYRYTYEGTEYTSRYKRNHDAYAERDAGKPKLGGDITLFIDPDDPSTYYLPGDSSPDSLMLFWVLLGLAIIVIVLRIRRS